MMNSCGTCRFKGPAVVRHDAPEGQGTLLATATGYFVSLAMHQLGAVKVGAGEVTAQAPAAVFEASGGAGVGDRSGHGASLCVTDDFGCRRWQPA
jgi:hypothetical protein